MPHKPTEAALLLIDILSGYILLKRIGARLLVVLGLD